MIVLWIVFYVLYLVAVFLDVYRMTYSSVKRKMFERYRGRKVSYSLMLCVIVGIINIKSLAEFLVEGYFHNVQQASIYWLLLFSVFLTLCFRRGRIPGFIPRSFVEWVKLIQYESLPPEKQVRYLYRDMFVTACEEKKKRDGKNFDIIGAITLEGELLAVCASIREGEFWKRCCEVALENGFDAEKILKEEFEFAMDRYGIQNDLT